MPVTASLSDASRQKLDGIVAQMQKNGESDSYIQGVVNDFKGKYGGMGTSAPQQPSAWNRFTDAVVAALPHPIDAAEEWWNRGGEIKKAMDALPALDKQIAGKQLSPDEQQAINDGMNAHLVSADDASIPDSGTAVNAATQIGDRNYAGAAGTMLGGYGSQAALGAAIATTPALANAVSAKTGTAMSAVVNSPVVRAVGPVLAKQGLKIAANYIPVVGPMIRTGMDVYEAASKLQKIANAAKESGAVAESPVTPPQTPSAPPQVSTKVQIPTKFSVDSASDTMGTHAPSATPTAAPEAASGLDQTTHQRLAEAVQSGKLQALPADAKASITQAVKAGDTTRVNAILDLGRDVSISELKHIASTNNKVAVLLKYATDHGIDIESVPPEARQTFADAAMAHAKQLGLTDLLSTNKSGRYTGTHESAFALMKAKLAAGGQ